MVPLGLLAAFSAVLHIKLDVSKQNIKNIEQNLTFGSWVLLNFKSESLKHSVFSTLALPTWTLICDLQVQLDVALTNFQNTMSFF